MIQETLVLIKPDAIERGVAGEIIANLGTHVGTNWKSRLLIPPRSQYWLHYKDHVGKDFFPGLIEAMACKPVIALCGYGYNIVSQTREFVNFIRHDLMSLLVDGPRNLIHASDSPKAAAREIELWFK